MSVADGDAHPASQTATVVAGASSCALPRDRNLRKELRVTPARPPHSRREDQPLRVFVSADGAIDVNGCPTSLDALKEELEALSERDGVVWYSRESGESEPSAAAEVTVQRVIELIVAAKRPMMLFRDRQFLQPLTPNPG